MCTKIFSKTYLVWFVILIIHNIILGQHEPDPSQLFRGLQIVPYHSDRTTHDDIIQQYDLEDDVENRAKALGFYNLMIGISEPSTLSLFSNYIFNIDDYEKKPLLLDANVQIPIAIGGKKWINKGRMMHTFHIIPQFKVRNFLNDNSAPGDPYGIIRGDTSLPVRTPSYMPRLTYYFTWASLFNRHPVAELSRSTFFGISAFHHSNGQDGPEFYDDPRVNVFNADFGDINVYNGNFGENLVFELIAGGVVDFRSGRLIRPKTRDASHLSEGRSRSARTDSVNINYPFNRRWYWRASFEMHLPGLTNKTFSDLNLYGRYRLNLQSGFSWIPAFRDLIRAERNGQPCWVQATPFESKEAWRLVGNFQYILDPQYNDGNLLVQNKVPYFDFRRLNIYGTLYWRMTGSPNSALFVQAGYWGSDNYNIYFQEQIIQTKIGVAFAFFKYPKLADFEREPLSR